MRAPDTDATPTSTDIAPDDDTARRRLAEAVHAACLHEVQAAYEQASISGLCGEGAWECAVSALRNLNLDALLKPD